MQKDATEDLQRMFGAGLSGAAIPVVMKAVGLDSAQYSSNILTTVTDVAGFFAFLGFTVVFQSHLMQAALERQLNHWRAWRLFPGFSGKC